MKFDPKYFLETGRNQGIEFRIVKNKIRLQMTHGTPSIWLQTTKKHRRAIITALREEEERPLNLDLFYDDF